MEIILVVTGSIAAYKAADIARRLMDEGLKVRVAMTDSAEKFVTPLTFEALTGAPVFRSCFPLPGEEPMGHITFSRGAKLALVAPATANFIGKLANGIADDNVSTMLMASSLPLMVAPAMNSKMYNHPAVIQNIATLKQRGAIFIGPAEGELACGDVGEGKLEDVGVITSRVIKELELKRDLRGLKIIVTAGGTREPIDPVRFIGNRSSGKMGIAIAKAALMRGAEVSLIAGALEVDPPEGMEIVKAETAEKMLEQVSARFDSADALIMSAAVGDYHATHVSTEKVGKKEEWDIKLVKNRDIILEMSRRRRGQALVGFAAETSDIEKRGREKLLRKNMDMIVINDVSRPDIGFGSDENEITIITRKGETRKTSKMAKSDIAEIILDCIARLVTDGKTVSGRKVAK
ncbi:Phosphopantothenoylcysteine decarboxylase / Phosphopantothenoylcysteine synthetase [hydrothermal vent metagenome]|uniref:Phosphopantothenoylcysteine decarboxylase / Phosphopantothenoylcysteine synthetase n=1 Tax=hydrothermal vent metagenome TaxID=652676 RepID=A0A3B1C3P4_9ZZZZ